MFSVSVYAPAAVAAHVSTSDAWMTSYVPAPPHEAAAVVDGDADARVVVDAAGELAEPIAHDVVGDDRIDLDAVDVPRAEDQGRDQVASAAGADDERGSKPGSESCQVIGERRELVAQVLRVRQVRRDMRRIGVDAAESMSMNRVSGSGPL